MPGEFQRVKDIFLVAAGKTGPGEREEYLREACGPDVALRRRVEALLRRHEQAAGFLEMPAFNAAALSRPDVVPAELQAPRPRLDRYRVLRVLGEGGMGTVYEAQQDNPRRTVA